MALTDTQFLLGSAVPRTQDLSLGYYSLDTLREALQDGEAHIQAICKRLVAEGRLSPRSL